MDDLEKKKEREESERQVRRLERGMGLKEKMKEIERKIE